MTSLLNGPTLSLKLAEPFVFVTAPPRGASAAAQGPVLVRGLLVLKLPKPTKITSIDVVFDGRATTDWPEGQSSASYMVVLYLSSKNSTLQYTLK